MYLLLEQTFKLISLKCIMQILYSSHNYSSLQKYVELQFQEPKNWATSKSLIWIMRYLLSKTFVWKYVLYKLYIELITLKYLFIINLVTVLIFLKQVRLPITLLFAFMGLNIFHIGHTTTNKSYYLLKARFATLNYWTLNQSFKPPFVCFINEKQKRFHDILIKYMCPLK